MNLFPRKAAHPRACACQTIIGTVFGCPPASVCQTRIVIVQSSPCHILMLTETFCMDSRPSNVRLGRQCISLSFVRKQVFLEHSCFRFTVSGLLLFSEKSKHILRRTPKAWALHIHGGTDTVRFLRKTRRNSFRKTKCCFSSTHWVLSLAPMS